jgi:hypothetical protein
MFDVLPMTSSFETAASRPPQDEDRFYFLILRSVRRTRLEG